MGLRILFLVTDAYGGHGGIAAYNRCLCEAIAEMPEVAEIVVVPRIMRFADASVPSTKIVFMHAAAGSKLHYLQVLISLVHKPFDLLICGHINLLPLAAPFALAKRLPLTLQVHGIDVWSPAPLLRRIWLKYVAAVWTVSGVTRERMNVWAKLKLAKYHVIPNTVRAEKFGVGLRRPDLVERYRLEGAKVVVTLARLAANERYKGVDEMLETLPALLDGEPTLKYLILGDGDDQQRLEDKARALGLADTVVFAGYIGESEKADHLRLADVFALPGRGEGFGIVYLEALACGIPTLGSKVDGSREALRDGELGELVDPDDLASIRDGLLRALKQPKTILPGLDYFSWPNFQARVAGSIRSVLIRS
jgi:phosphatidylinositol alpha-1,6-mannosyltransferase